MSMWRNKYEWGKTPKTCSKPKINLAENITADYASQAGQLEELLKERRKPITKSH